MIGLAAALSVALATGSLAWGYLQTDSPLAALSALFLGLGWLLSASQRWREAPAVLLMVAIGVSAFGVSLGMPTHWALIGSVAALVGADLSGFWLRLAEAANVDESALLEQRHLARTLGIAIASLILAALAQRARIRLGLGTALLLGLLTVWGLSRGIASLRRESD